MRTSLGQMDGDTWEKYCHKLLGIRFHANYQKVPAQFGGDLGIDGFTKSGLVFQCYCPEEDLSGIELYEKQRDKITKDITKLIRNATKISQLGAGTILAWHFLTPDFNSRDLLTHCQKKESEVRAKQSAAISSEFETILQIEDNYILERQMLLGSGGLMVQPSGEQPPQDELEALLTSDNDIIVNIRTKLNKLPLATNQREGLIRQLVSAYIIGRNELENLNEKFPSAYQSVIQLKSATESQLSILTLSSDSNKNGAILHEILKVYAGRLESDLSNSLSSALIANLSTEAISDWLGSCPLDFPSLEGNDESN